MKIIISFFFLMNFSFATEKSPKVKDQVSLDTKTMKLQLPKEAYEALKKWNPEYRIFEIEGYSPSIKSLVQEISPDSAPMAMLGDYDSDGSMDVAILGEDSKKQHAVVLLNKSQKWVVVKLEDWSIEKVTQTTIPDLTTGEKSTEKGIPIYILPVLGDHAKKLGKKKGIQVEYYAGQGKVFEIKQDKASQVILK